MGIKYTPPKNLMPENAKRVFKGVIFDVYHWEQEMYDGTRTIFEKLWRPPTVEVVATVGDKILIEEQDQPDNKDCITLPSGRADQGEDVLAEAKRELLEETGYRSDDWSLFMENGKKGKILHEVYYFIARDCKKVQEQNLDGGERIKNKLITFEEFVDLSDESRFWVSPEFINFLLRLKLYPEEKEKFRKLLFPEEPLR